MFHHFEDARSTEGPPTPVKPALLRDTRSRQFLIGLCVILLIAATAGCARNLGGDISGWSPATASEGLVYVGTKQGDVKSLADNGFGDVSLRATSGEVVPGIHNNLVIGESLVFATASDGFLYALEKEGNWNISIFLLR